MTKLLPLRSIEYAIRRAFGILGEDGVRAAIHDHLGIDRSTSLIRKCGNPDDDSHHLQMRYAAALDRACWEARRTRPLLEAYEHLVSPTPTAGAEEGMTSKAEVCDAVVALQVALGDLSRLVRTAYSEDSADPEGLTHAERAEIGEAVGMLESHAEMFKSMVLDGAPPPPEAGKPL